jgi:hypothetical protein
MKQKDKQAVLIMFFSLIFVAGLLIVAEQLSSSEKIDEKTLCPIDRPISFQKIVIFDKSDMWERDNIKKMNDWLSMSHQNILAHERFTILGIVGEDRNSTEVKILFDRCNPGSEKECNKLYQNCTRIKEKYDNSFENPLQKIEQLLSIPTQASYSPLFETVAQVIDSTRSKQIEIHMVSDFMENGYKFDFYNTVPLGEDIIKEYPLSVDANISFHMNIIERRRHDKRLIDAVVATWREYFSLQGIKNIEDKRLFITD